MELKTIEQINHELDILDAKRSILNLYYQDAANQRLHYEELCESLRGSINQNRNDYNELEQRKKELCGTIKTDTHLNKESCSPSNAANAVIEDYARPASMCVKVAKTLND